jgi:phosphohistidine phosphatase SixA
MKNRATKVRAAGLLILSFLIVTLGSSFSAEPSAKSGREESAPLIVFLVRHGEKADSSRDPELSPAGLARAKELARVLHDVKLEHVHSSDFIRTKATAGPTARDHGLNVESYDPRDLRSLVKKLQRTGGSHLVVGHSNTTPLVATLLGGEATPKIDEKDEFDRLYVVTVGADGTAQSVMLRYGKAFAVEPALGD